MSLTSESSRRILFPERATTAGSEVFESPIWDTWTICNVDFIKTNTEPSSENFLNWELDSWPDSEQYSMDILFSNCYLAAPRPTLGHYQGGSFTHPMLITCILHIRPEGHRESRSEVGSLSPAERLVGFEPGTFRFWSQRLNPHHYPPTAIYLLKVITVTSEKPCYDYLRRCCVDVKQPNTCWKTATYFFVVLIKQATIVHRILYSFCKICIITKSKSIRKTCIEFCLSLRRSI